MSLKSLVIDCCDDEIFIDPESLVGQYASLQHLELGCEKIRISATEEPGALVPLEGQFCNLVLRTRFPLESNQQESLLSLGFKTAPYNTPPASPQFPITFQMQFGAQSSQPIPSSPCDSFHRGISTSFARDSEEHTLLLSKEYQTFFEAIPWSLCYTDELLDSDLDGSDDDNSHASSFGDGVDSDE